MNRIFSRLAPLSFFNNMYIWWKRFIVNGKPITIIKYHSISDISDPQSISPKSFSLQLELIKNKYNIERLCNINNLISNNYDSKKRFVIFCFDDAYSNFFEIAYPILYQLNIPSTIFIPTGYIGKYNVWDSHVQNYIMRSIMTASQLIELKNQGLVDFGSHSVSHQSMTRLSIAEMNKEAIESRITLESILERKICMFSYPYGHFSKKTNNVLKDAHYDIAVTSSIGSLNSYKDILCLKIIYLSDKDTHSTILAKINGLYDIFNIKGIRRLKRLMAS